MENFNLRKMLKTKLVIWVTNKIITERSDDALLYLK